KLARFLRSAFELDPAAIIRRLDQVPITIVQGDTDVQVSVEDDARKLAAAQPKAQLKVLHEVNHVLKYESQKTLAQASYHDPAVPLGPKVADAIASGVARASAPSPGRR